MSDLRVVLYASDGRRSSTTWCGTVARARAIVDDADRDQVLARVLWPDGREMELHRREPGEAWVITGRRRAA